MDQFEIAATLMSFIYAIAITHVLQSCAELWIARARVTFSASHAIWMLAVLFNAILAWMSLSAYLGLNITGARFGGQMAYAVGVYFSCALVSPRVPEEGQLDLLAYEDRHGLGWKAVMIALMLFVALPLDYELWRRTNPSGDALSFAASQWLLAAVVLGTSVTLLRPRWLRIGGAAVVLAVAARVLIFNVS